MFEKITVDTLPVFVGMLNKEHLCTEDIDLQVHLYFGIIEKDVLIGGYGLEIYETEALLRSVVLANDKRGLGFGKHIMDHVNKIANQHHIQRMYLLTTTAADYFERFGFEKIDRQNVPRQIGNTVEFRTFCPDSATCMQLNVSSYVR